MNKLDRKDLQVKNTDTLPEAVYYLLDKINELVDEVNDLRIKVNRAESAAFQNINL